ncbi:hypothetical protein EHW67_00410 [Arenibacter aquaticus]|uniref:Uncharacterized protein n=1 Tax=Arenibacter aquaticus TaxID=2489054 RepID=A0A430K7L7_9FLAO|nr:hypothetical protein [Arenibacter aquaticus]RTE55066.1 hypothetical protein EHW67_00410 [Arenibacter aquaticus]
MKYLIGLLIVLLVSNCNDSDVEDQPDCADIACTQEYRTITVNVKDREGNAVALDMFSVVILPNETDITADWSDNEIELMAKNGVYPLFSDKYSNTYRNRQIEINFKGYLDDKQVLDANYTVGADCCHVFLVDGETNLIVGDL